MRTSAAIAATGYRTTGTIDTSRHKDMGGTCPPFATSRQIMTQHDRAPAAPLRETWRPLNHHPAEG